LDEDQAPPLTQGGSTPENARAWTPYGSGNLSVFVSSAIDLNKVIWKPTFGDDFTRFQFK